MGSFQVLFSGDLVKGADVETVRPRIARELGIDERKARQLFSGRTVVIRNQLEGQDAQALQQRFYDLGALCRVKNVGVPDSGKGNNRHNAQFDRDAARFEQRMDHTLRDITAAFIECARCGHMQLESSHCARCGIEIGAAAEQKHREDMLIEKQIRALRAKRALAEQAATASSERRPHPSSPPKT